MRYNALVCVFGVLVCAAAVWSQTNSPAISPTNSKAGADAQSPPPTPDIKVDVKLVNVFTTVTDSNGAPVASLKKENVQVLEDETRDLQKTAEELASLIDLLRTQAKQEQVAEKRARAERIASGPAPSRGPAQGRNLG